MHIKSAKNNKTKLSVFVAKHTILSEYNVFKYFLEHYCIIIDYLFTVLWKRQ